MHKIPAFTANFVNILLKSKSNGKYSERNIHNFSIIIIFRKWNNCNEVLTHSKTNDNNEPNVANTK